MDVTHVIFMLVMTPHQHEHDDEFNGEALRELAEEEVSTLANLALLQQKVKPMVTITLITLLSPLKPPQYTRKNNLRNLY